MSRRGGSSAHNIQLLPFLDILTCTMGALVTLLFAFARFGQQQVTEVSESKQVAAEVAAANEIEDLQWRASVLRDARAKTEADLGDARLELSHLEDHLRRLRERAEQIHEAALALANADPRAAQAKADDDLSKLKERIALTAQELEVARQNAAGRSTTYSIVPYAGPNQTRRRPIYIECRAEGVVLEPEGILFKDADFDGPLGPGNPLAAAIRAAREYLAANDPDEFDKVEPYPLLVVRPDAIPQYYAARSALLSFGSQFGYELIGADKKLKFPEPDPRLAEVVNNVVAEARIRHEALIAAAPKRYRHKGKGSFHVRADGGGVEREPEPSSVAQNENNPYRGIGRGSGGGRGGGKGKGTGGNGSGSDTVATGGNGGGGNIPGGANGGGPYGPGGAYAANGANGPGGGGGTGGANAMGGAGGPDGNGQSPGGRGSGGRFAGGGAGTGNGGTGTGSGDPLGVGDVTGGGYGPGGPEPDAGGYGPGGQNSGGPGGQNSGGPGGPGGPNNGGGYGPGGRSLASSDGPGGPNMVGGNGQGGPNINGGNGQGGQPGGGTGTGILGPGGYGTGGGPNGPNGAGGNGGYTPGGGGGGGGGYGPGGLTGGANGSGYKMNAGAPGTPGGVPGSGLSALAGPGGAPGAGGGPNGGQTGAAGSGTPGGGGQPNGADKGGDGSGGNSPGTAGQGGSGSGGGRGGRLAMSGDSQPDSGGDDDPLGGSSGNGTPLTTTLQGTGGSEAGSDQGTGSGTGPGGGGMGGLGGNPIGTPGNNVPVGSQQRSSGGSGAVPNTRAEQVTNASGHSVGGGADNTGSSNKQGSGSSSSGGMLSGASSGGGGSSSSSTSSSSNSGNSSMGGQQQGVGMPNLNFGQKPPSDPDMSVAGRHGGKRGAQGRPPGWALPDMPATSASVARPVVVECYTNRLVILADDGKSAAKQIPMTQHTDDAVDELVSSVMQQTKQWGAAGKGLSWRPTLSIRVAPDAHARFEELQSALADSGMEVKQSTYKPLAKKKSFNPLRK